MIETKIITERYENGEMQRYQIALGFSWSNISFKIPPFSREAYEEFVRMYEAFIIPKHRSWYGALVIFHLPKDIKIPFSFETAIGTVFDPQLAFAAELEKQYKAGLIKKENDDIVICDKKTNDFISFLKEKGWLKVLCGDKDCVSILPVSNTFGYLSETKPCPELSVNSHFFTMDVFDHDSPYDTFGVSYGLALKEGVVIQPPLFYREALLVDKNKNCHVKKISVTELSITINGFTLKDGDNATFYQRPLDRVTPKTSGSDIVIIGNKVIAYHKGGETLIPSSGFIIQTKEDIPYSESQVIYQGLEEYIFGIQVGSAVVRNTEKITELSSPFYDIEVDPISYPPTLYPLDYDSARAPRMAIGATKDDEPILIWSEGCSKLRYDKGNESAGPSLLELADFGYRQGLKHLVNLDGGGSAEMFFKGKAMMHVSDRHPDNSDSERPVPMGLIIQ